MGVAGDYIMLIGAVFTLIAAIGLHRFDDVFARMHAAGKASTLGMGLLLLGAAVRLGDNGTWAKLAVAGTLALITIPAGVHLIARAAYRSGTELADSTVRDDLAEARRLQQAVSELDDD